MEQYTFVRLHAREGEESAVEEALREVTGPTREEAGCLSFHTFRSMRDRRLFYIHSRWVDQAAFHEHAQCHIRCDSSNAWMRCSISRAMLRGQR
jgi:quinol monooxygenase YgiN